jgi:transposase
MNRRYGANPYSSIGREALQNETQTASERKRERMKRWREANREHIQSYQKAWRVENAGAVAEYQKEYQKEYRERDEARAATMQRNLWKNYKMTPTEFNELWDAQSGRCSICSVDMVPRGRAKNSVAVDHNHENGAVRGLLCRSCNVGIGYLQDDPDLLIAAAEYLVERGFYAFSKKKV